MTMTPRRWYGGISGEKPVARAAIDATRGQVLTALFQGREGIFCARYSACIGGASQDPFDAWGDATVSPLAAHLTGNVDANCDKFTWDRDFFVTTSDLTRCIRNWGEQNDLPPLARLATIKSVTIAKRNPTTNRPIQFLLTDTSGTQAVIRAEEFRLALKYDPLNRAAKPYSSNFDIRPDGDGFLMYNGHGFGHGIGLSPVERPEPRALKATPTPKSSRTFTPAQPSAISGETSPLRLQPTQPPRHQHDDKRRCRHQRSLCRPRIRDFTGFAHVVPDLDRQRPRRGGRSHQHDRRPEFPQRPGES